MWNRTIYVSSSWAGKPGRTAYGSQLEEWKAAGLGGFRMLHMSKVKFSSMFNSFCIMSNGLFLHVPFSFRRFHVLPWRCLSMSHLCTFALKFVLQHQLPSLGHFACCWDPFTRLEMKEDVCLLFLHMNSNIPSSASCSMQDASEVPSAGLSICFPRRHFIWSSIK